MTERYREVTDKSMYRQKNTDKEKFTPATVKEIPVEDEGLEEFILKPLYTQKEIRDFRRKNEKAGEFIVTENTVQSIEDLEKLFFVWQEVTERAESDADVAIEEEVETKGFKFSKLRIKEK